MTTPNSEEEANRYEAAFGKLSTGRVALGTFAPSVLDSTTAEESLQPLGAPVSQSRSSNLRLRSWMMHCDERS